MWTLKIFVLVFLLPFAKSGDESKSNQRKYYSSIRSRIVITSILIIRPILRDVMRDEKCIFHFVIIKL